MRPPQAKRTLLMRHESDLKDNSYWLGLLAHIQSEQVPRKQVECIADLPSLYQAATVEDVQEAFTHLSLDDDSLFTCVGVAGAGVGPREGETVVEIVGEKEEEVEEGENASGFDCPS